MSPIVLNKGRISRPQAELLTVWSSELVDWWGRRLDLNGNRIVRYSGKHWFVKCKLDPEEKKRDYLAYLLGKDWTNVAEVCTLHESEFNDLHHAGIVLPKWASMANTFLVRLGQDYTIDQLPNTDIDSAVAKELVFSLWIRRRDTHAANRTYISRIPVFFDHQTSFLGEPLLSHLDVFFQPGHDAGYANRWRVEKASPETSISTVEMRKIGKVRDMAIHFVQKLSRFNKSIQDAAEWVQSQSREEWFQAALESGYSELKASQITTFLDKNRIELDIAIERLQAVIFENK